MHSLRALPRSREKQKQQTWRGRCTPKHTEKGQMYSVGNNTQRAQRRLVCNEKQLHWRVQEGGGMECGVYMYGTACAYAHVCSSAYSSQQESTVPKQHPVTHTHKHTTCTHTSTRAPTPLATPHQNPPDVLIWWDAPRTVQIQLHIQNAHTQHVQTQHSSMRNTMCEKVLVCVHRVHIRDCCKR